MSLLPQNFGPCHVFITACRNLEGKLLADLVLSKVPAYKKFAFVTDMVLRCA
jgi:hypothetical protein